jgi:hypothetical protein
MCNDLGNTWIRDMCTFRGLVFVYFWRVYHLFSSVDPKYYNMFDSVCQGHSLTVSNLQYERKYETLKMGQVWCLSGFLSVMYRKLTSIIGAATNFAKGRIKHNKRSAKHIILSLMDWIFRHTQIYINYLTQLRILSWSKEVNTIVWLSCYKELLFFNVILYLFTYTNVQ